MYFHKKCRLPIHAFSAPCYTSHTGLTAFQRSQAGSIRRKTGLTRDRFCYKYSTQLHCTGWRRTSTWWTSWSRTTLLSDLRPSWDIMDWVKAIPTHMVSAGCGVQRQEQLQVLHSNQTWLKLIFSDWDHQIKSFVKKWFDLKFFAQFANDLSAHDLDHSLILCTLANSFLLLLDYFPKNLTLQAAGTPSRCIG